MSQHIEWVDAGHPFFGAELLEEGDCVKGHDSTDDCDDECRLESPAIVLGTDDTVVICGDIETLRKMVDALRVMVGGPVT